MTQTISTIPLKTIDGKVASLGDYAGKVLLVVNVASKCGLTPQYDGLEALHETLEGKGFSVGPPMSARSFATARLMETWAHGQDVWDVVRRRRPPTPRLKHIAHLGATTFKWTFVNRGLAVPGVAPFIELAAPGGATWCWNEVSAEHFVRGSAEDFCLLVTQRRHLDDTGLHCSEGMAREWLLIAQCFAGPPADGPAAGVRRVMY